MRLRPSLTQIIGILGIFCVRSLFAAELPPQDPYAKPVNLSCPAETFVTSQRCEGGLCLTSVPGGVAGDHVTIEGRLDGGTSTGLIVLAQHDHSKSVVRVDATKLLSADGKFAVTIPLSQLGNYTIVIQAMRVALPPSVIQARVSRVIAPQNLSSSELVIPNPDPNVDHITISVDLEKNCREQSKTGLPKDCDLIGSKTGATRIEAVNDISSGRRVTRSTNSIDGAEGKFSLCMPLGNGDNKISVQVCSPALPSCVMLGTQTISFSKPEPAVRWLDTNPEHLRFAMDHWTPPKSATVTCAGEIELEWNREPKQKLCPSNGVYTIANRPVVGVNEIGIGEFRFTFGWGKAVWARDFAQSVMALQIAPSVLDRNLPGILNRFLESGQFPKLIASLLSGGDKASKVAPDPAELAELAAIRAAIPACGVPAAGHVATQVTGDVTVGSAHVDQVSLDDNKISLQLSLTHVNIPINVFGDADGNGIPDNGFLPLRIGFKQLLLRPKIILSSDSSLVLLSSDTDDCAYKSATYCKHQPAIFMPSMMVGEATKGGAIVACNDLEQLGGTDLHKKCTSLDIVNMQTGQLSETIIDTLNETLYCDVSARMTYALRHARVEKADTLKWLGRSFDWKVMTGLDPGGLHVGRDGIRMSMGSQMSGNGFYYATPHPAAAAPAGHTMGVALREDLLNQTLAMLVTMGKPGEGLLDWILDEARIKGMGFDFNTECATTTTDKKLPLLCTFRPTVTHLLGSDLSNAHYYDDKQPLRVTIHGDRELAPHVRFRKTDSGERVVDLDIPKLELGFAAIPENPAEEDRPIIRAQMTLLLSFTLDELKTYDKNPAMMAVHLRLRSQESRVVIVPVAGSNRTVLPDDALVAQLRSVISIGLNEFGKSADGLPPLTLPKSILLPATAVSDSDETLLTRLGLSEIRWGDERLQWDINPFAGSLTLAADPLIIQRLLVNGVMQEYTWE